MASGRRRRKIMVSACDLMIFYWFEDDIPCDLTSGPPQAEKFRIWACDLMIPLRFSADSPYDLGACGAQNPYFSIKS